MRKWILLFVVAWLIAVTVASAEGMTASNPWCWLWFVGPQVQWIPLVVGP